MFGGFVGRVVGKKGKESWVFRCIDPAVMVLLLVLAAWSWLVASYVLAWPTIVAFALLGFIAYVSIDRTTGLVPDGIRHTWMAGIAFVVVAVALGTAMALLYGVIGVTLIIADLVRHSVQRRTLTQHSHDCEMLHR